MVYFASPSLLFPLHLINPLPGEKCLPEPNNAIPSSSNEDSEGGVEEANWSPHRQTSFPWNVCCRGDSEKMVGPMWSSSSRRFSMDTLQLSEPSSDSTTPTRTPRIAMCHSYINASQANPHSGLRLRRSASLGAPSSSLWLYIIDFA